jgi:two-component system cell cycle response regulator DivK
MTRPATILVVEDHPLNRELTEAMLLRAGYTVLMAGDAETGLACATTDHPDLILMDIELPGLDGLEATRRLKADPCTADIPVLAVTAYAMRRDEERALGAGCDGFVTKPVERQLLLATVERFLRRDREGALA